MNKIIASIAALAATATVAAPAFAAPVNENDGRLSTEIRTEDLDLASAKGQATLNYRIKKAAAAVCAPLNISVGRLTSGHYSDCVALAVNNASAASKPLITAARARSVKIAAR